MNKSQFLSVPFLCFLTCCFYGSKYQQVRKQKDFVCSFKVLDNLNLHVKHEPDLLSWLALKNSNCDSYSYKIVKNAGLLNIIDTTEIKVENGIVVCRTYKSVRITKKVKKWVCVPSLEHCPMNIEVLRKKKHGEKEFIKYLRKHESEHLINKSEYEILECWSENSQNRFLENGDSFPALTLDEACEIIINNQCVEIYSKQNIDTAENLDTKFPYLFPYKLVWDFHLTNTEKNMEDYIFNDYYMIGFEWHCAEN